MWFTPPTKMIGKSEGDALIVFKDEFRLRKKEGKNKDDDIKFFGVILLKGIKE